ncbi:leucyl/phenylalanyl-tRNA--protein transferase [Fluviibacterium sp. DFM31]|uniref:Leucyl/phenylalanyl-tRNA--protein transferase n=1 Tax=Meridianimarinicoccus marinus TaxID=3231483 RepID=A0ABV3LBN4_9RHOB
MDRRDITPDILLKAYALGVFPMAESREDPEIFWVDPRHRGILPLDRFHMSRSLARHVRRGGFEVAIDRDFAATVEGCAERAETWINATIFDLYLQLHRKGHAHSLEIRQDNQLIGGVYGVALGGAFFGESMFSRRDNASKTALAFLVDRLTRAGFILFDTQFITPHLSRLGAVEISRADYHQRLESAVARPADFRAPETPTPQELVQRMTQTS